MNLTIEKEDADTAGGRDSISSCLTATAARRQFNADVKCYIGSIEIAGKYYILGDDIRGLICDWPSFSIRNCQEPSILAYKQLVKDRLPLTFELEESK